MPIGNYGVNIQRVGLINNIKKENKVDDEEIVKEEIEEEQEQEHKQEQQQEQQFIQIQKR